ncbi:MAG: ectoine dioxygenase [Candidatus Hydrogenedentota bacterium]
MKDLYPTRQSDAFAMTDRKDPVVHSGLGSTAGPLSRAQLTAYDRYGYLFFENFFGHEEVQTVKAELESLRQSREVKKAEYSITEPNSGEVRSIFDVTRSSLIFFALSRNPRLVDIVRQLLNDHVYIHQSRVNLKPGFAGKEFYWHSDFETWHAEDGMPRMRAVSCSIALTENNEFNGPLMVVPGSHKTFVSCGGATPENHYKQSLKRQEYGVPDPSSLRALVDQGGIVAPKGGPGSVLLFECNLMHGSNSNISPYPRSNVFFVYNSVSNALGKPFAAKSQRPEFIASRDFTPIAPMDVKPSVAAMQPA